MNVDGVERDELDAPIEFLRARLTEDELRGLDGRELRELATKRAVLAAFDRVARNHPAVASDENNRHYWTWWDFRWVLLNFAAIYDDHPDYLSGWRPKP